MAAASRSNYFDLAMIMDYWSDKRLNHHTEAASMLFAARECARVVLEEGLEARFARHAQAGAAVVAGVEAMGLQVYGDQAHKMTNVTAVLTPAGVDGDRVRGPHAHRLRDRDRQRLSARWRGKVWRIGAMGVNARKHAVLQTALAALEAVLRGEGGSGAGPSMRAGAARRRERLFHKGGRRRGGKGERRGPAPPPPPHSTSPLPP